MRIFNKKGNAQMILTGVITLFAVGVLLIVGMIMMESLMEETADDSYTVVNESISTVTEAGDMVAFGGYCGFHNFAIVNCINETGDQLGSGNWSIPDGGKSGLIQYSGPTAETWNNSNWNCTYSFMGSNKTACTASNSTLYGQGKFADYFDLIVLAIVIGAIISLIVIGFAGRKIR